MHHRTILPQTHFITEQFYHRTIAPQNYWTTEELHHGTNVPQNCCTTQPLHNRTIAPLHQTTIEPLHQTTIEPLHQTTMEPLHQTTIEPLHHTTILTLALQVRQTAVNVVVGLEVACWFFIGECIGKGSIVRSHSRWLLITAPHILLPLPCDHPFSNHPYYDCPFFLPNALEDGI